MESFVGEGGGGGGGVLVSCGVLGKGELWFWDESIGGVEEGASGGHCGQERRVSVN